MKIGYARVSTEDQDTGSQVAELQRTGCERLYHDVISGSKTERPELSRMMQELKFGDIVIVCRLDRLGRSLKHLMGLIEEFQKLGVGFKSLAESMDTTSPQGKFVFHVIGAMAEFERNLIAARTRATLQHLKSTGVKLGPPVKDRSEQAIQLKKRITHGESRSAICQAMGLSRAQYFVIRKIANVNSIRTKRFRTKIGQYGN